MRRSLYLRFLTGLVYKHIVPKGITIYANYTVVALDKFRKYLLKKRPEMVEGDCFSIKTKPLCPHCCHCQELAGCQIDSVLLHPLLHSPDHVAEDFFLFRMVKK